MGSTGDKTRSTDHWLLRVACVMVLPDGPLPPPRYSHASNAFPPASTVQSTAHPTERGENGTSSAISTSPPASYSELARAEWSIDYDSVNNERDHECEFEGQSGSPDEGSEMEDMRLRQAISDLALERNAR